MTGSTTTTGAPWLTPGPGDTPALADVWLLVRAVQDHRGAVRLTEEQEHALRRLAAVTARVGPDKE